MFNTLFNTLGQTYRHVVGKWEEIGEPGGNPGNKTIVREPISFDTATVLTVAREVSILTNVCSCLIADLPISPTQKSDDRHVRITMLAKLQIF